MSFSIHYRSTETMHPAQAFEIKQHAESLVGRYSWLSCEPISLKQQPDGYLSGQSKPTFFPAEVESEAVHIDGMPDGTVLSLAEVLCVLSREHGVDWSIGHDYEPEPIGQISNGVAGEDLIEQLETFGSIGDLLDDSLDSFDGENPDTWSANSNNDVESAAQGEDHDDEGPRLLKFPSVE